MPPLPALTNWDSTRMTLHQAAQVLGAIREFQATPQSNYHHLPLMVTPNGLRSGPLPVGGELVLDFNRAHITYTCPADTCSTIPLSGHTQTSLAAAVLEAMAKTGHPAEPSPASFNGTHPLVIDRIQASDYASALYRVFTALARVRARLNGSQTALVVWPHGFDLSGLWFQRGFDEAADPHINIGFSPGSPGIDRPYVYLYAWPQPPGWTTLSLPELAHWHQQNWTGVVIPYDSLAPLPNPEAKLEDLLETVMKAVQEVMT
ncbi:MAG TPA: DUF5996 family protein [Aggregatilineales bacterium]|nr:DUF5996 family protein [Aggregatilineales bacterium]